MVFSSLVFLFGFLAVHLAVYALVPQRYKNPVLLASSLIFYAWGGPRYVLLLVGETLASWFFALRIESAPSRASKRLFLVGECVVLLGLLAYFKYWGFIMENTQALFGVPEVVPQVVLPIGISFYTFQLISYVCDVYRGQVAAQPTFWKLLLYSSLFHQCIAGPIVRYETVQEQIDNRMPTPADIYAGVRRFCIGLAKKAVLANSCASVADTLLPLGGDGLASQAVAGYWLGMVFYMFQIYLDFSAYSDMAIGMGRMVGFRYLENFNYPYMAKSVQDFWRRWHISLSSFFRDYVYIPLGGSRCSTVLFVRNMTVVWFLTGLWHGASWNYILWGLYYLVFLLVERFFIRDRMGDALGHVWALVVVFFGWIIFRFEDLGELSLVLGGMFGLNGTPLVGLEVQTLFLQNIFLLAFCVVACTNLGKTLRERLIQAARGNNVAFGALLVTDMVLPAILFVLGVASLAGASYNPFIYFQF